MILTVVFLFWQAAAADAPKPAPAAPAAAEAPKEDATAASRRVELNLLGKTDTAAGESRRNENIQFNLVDNNALKELNVRLGISATLVSEFRPERNYFGTEFGNPAPGPPHVGASIRSAWHGTFNWAHLNSVFSARSFFQVGGVQPARENDYGFSLGGPLNRSKRTSLVIDGSQQKLRGQVNGNVLVPKPDERTALSTDPATNAVITRFLAAYPRILPNRTDINERALNTNAPQVIDNDNASIRLDHALTADGRHKLVAQYNFTAQAVDAFQLVAGQNPDTDTKNHRARLSFTRTAGTTIVEATAGFDRIGSVLRPEPNAVGQMISIAGLTTLGPLGSIPIDRAQNLFRYAAQLRQTRGAHNLTAGFGILRRQFNGIETDTHRGFFSFGNDFGRDSITNFRLGFPTQHIISVGDVHRGFRNWDMQFYAGDSWRIHPSLQLTAGIRYQPAPRPNEVNGRNTIAYDCDCNNVAPALGLAWRPASATKWAGTIRAAYGLHYGEIFPVTFQQVRLSPPGSVKVVVTAPDLFDPLNAPTQTGGRPIASPNLYLLDPQLTTPYSHQYNLAWEPETGSRWKLQMGYVGSRSHKLLIMWYLNRSHAVAGIPQTTATINQRRPDPAYAEKRLVVNGSRGYFDAARVTLVVPRWRGLSVDASYWLSKALDLGAAYSNTAYEADSRISRSQSEYDQHRDMKGLSSFDQKHAVLVRTSWAAPKRAGGWNFSSVVLLKSGTPFTVQAGSDGPGFGNVDGNGGDRPHLLDTAVLGRTIGNPDTSKAQLPRTAFAFSTALQEYGGSLGKNTFRKGGIYNVNASLTRAFTIAGEAKLTLRAESINFLNTPQFAEPGFELTNPNFGVITNTLNDGRTFRLGAQLGW